MFLKLHRTCYAWIPLWGPILALLYLSRSQSARRKQKFSTGRMMDSLESSQGQSPMIDGNQNTSRTSLDYIYNHNTSTEYDDSTNGKGKNALLKSRFLSHLSDDGESDTVNALHSDPEVARHLANVRTPQHGEGSDHTDEYYAVTVVPGTGHNVVRTSEGTMSTRDSSSNRFSHQSQGASLRLSQQRPGDNQYQPPKHPNSAQRSTMEEPTPSSQYVHHASPYYNQGPDPDSYDYDEIYGNSAVSRFSASQNDAMRIIMGGGSQDISQRGRGGVDDGRQYSQDNDNSTLSPPFSPDSSMNYLYRDTTATNLPSELFFPRINSGDHQADFSYRGEELHNGHYR